MTYLRLRVMLATIRNNGECPCPACLVRKEDISKMGSPEDRNTRESKQRVDNHERIDKVKRAQAQVLVHGKGVQSKPVEDLLSSESLVPTVVCSSALAISQGTHELSDLERIFQVPSPLRLRLSQDARGGPVARD